MNRFVIGMHGAFDEKKFNRGFRPGFWGIEACMFQDGNDVEKLVQKSRDVGFKFGVHYPLIKKETPYRDPPLMSPDRDERRAAWESLAREAELAAAKGAAYILTHFPKPVLVDRSLDLRYWRFAGEKEWMFSELYPENELGEAMAFMFEEISGINKKYGITVLLENDAMSKSIIDLMTGFFKRYSNVGMCLDLGRLHLQGEIDPGFDALQFTKKCASFVRLVHLWNTNPAQNLAGGHYPVLPGQNPRQGWADMRLYFDILNRAGREYMVMFEHRSDWITDEQLNACYDYVLELVEK